MDRAKEEAAQKGEEIGRAVKEGIERADPAEALFAPNKPGSNPGKLRMQDPGGSNFDLPPPANSGADPAAALSGGASMLAGGAVGAAIYALIAALAKIEKIGETVGSGLFEATKKQAELDIQIGRLNTSIAHQNAINDARFNRATSGNPFIDPEQQERVKHREAEAQAAEQKFVTHQANMGLGDYYSKGWEAVTFGLYESTLGQEERQAKELRADANRARSQVSAVERENRRMYGRGNILADEYRARGEEPPAGLETSGPTLSPIGADAQRAAAARMTQAALDKAAFWSRAGVMEKRDEIKNRNVERPQ